MASPRFFEHSPNHRSSISAQSGGILVNSILIEVYNKGAEEIF